MEYGVFVMVCLALYCPCFTALSWLTPWKGFSVFCVTRHHRRYLAIHLSLLDRVGTMNRRRAQRYHQAFIRALACALAQPVRTVFFRSHLMRSAQVRLACQVLSGGEGCRWRVVSVTVPLWERLAVVAQMLLQEWRLIPLPPRQAVMVVVRRSIH
ncbi:hypothetical protein EJH27_01625 [Salmonella enterica subsp. enterica serovar Virchow]|nr:hypothetical protein [Salmonella enterica subsp. enterica serovar Virchow]